MIDYLIEDTGQPVDWDTTGQRGGVVVRMRSRGPRGTPSRVYFVARCANHQHARIVVERHSAGLFSALH